MVGRGPGGRRAHRDRSPPLDAGASVSEWQTRPRRPRGLATVRGGTRRRRPARTSRVAGEELRGLRRRQRQAERRLRKLPQGLSRQGRRRRKWSRSMSVGHGGSIMRRISVGAALVIASAGPCFAQEWVQYASRADLFAVNFPVEPGVREITYSTEFGITLPGHVYRADS